VLSKCDLCRGSAFTPGMIPLFKLSGGRHYNGASERFHAKSGAPYSRDNPRSHDYGGRAFRNPRIGDFMNSQFVTLVSKPNLHSIVHREHKLNSRLVLLFALPCLASR